MSRLLNLYIITKLKDSIEVNGIETKINLSNGMMGYFPVFENRQQAEKWIKSDKPKPDILYFSGKAKTKGGLDE